MRLQRFWVVLVCAGLGFGCKPGAGKKTSSELGVGNTVSCDPQSYKADWSGIPRLAEIGSCSAFAGYLAASLSNASSKGRGMFGIPDPGSVAMGDTAAESAGPEAYTTTNVEEAGADEPDILKTDGKFIYTVSGGKLVIAKSWPPTALSIVSETVVEDSPHAILLHKDRLAVFSYLWPEEGVMEGDGFWGVKPMNEAPAPHVFMPQSRITIFNVADRAHPQVERTLDLEVWYQDARLINGRLLLVGESSLSFPNLGLEDTSTQTFVVEGPDPDSGTGSDGSVDSVEAQHAGEPHVITKEEIAAAIAKTKYEDWIPSMRDSLADAPSLMVSSFDALYMPSVTGETGMLAIVSLDLEAANAEVVSQGVIARGGRIYATTESLYTSYGSGGWAWNWGGPIDAPNAGTSIQKFSLGADGIPTYVGAGTVAGWISKAFQMSEHDGYLRVAASDAKTNHLFVLGPTATGDLELVGAVHDFAAGESIFSSRFIGDKGFVSTYHFILMADPFFTFDLSDPKHPTLIGELEMPGYTSYMHPLSEDYILGVGMFAEQMGDPVTSVQIQIFDVSNFAAPVTAFQHVITVGNGGSGSRSFSEVESTHHAFTYYAPEKLLAFPVSVWTDNWASSFNGVMAFRVDPAVGIEELGRTDHTVFSSDENWYASEVRRSIVMTGDDTTYLYSMSNAGLLVNAVADFNTVLGKAKLPLNEAMYSGGVPVSDVPTSERPE